MDRANVSVPDDLRHDEIDALALHDLTCPAGQHCGNRLTHTRSLPLVADGTMGRLGNYSFDVAMALSRRDVEAARVAAEAAEADER